MKIANNVFLVAGGGSGLGAASARMLTEAGAKVVVADLNDAAGWSGSALRSTRYCRRTIIRRRSPASFPKPWC